MRGGGRGGTRRFRWWLRNLPVSLPSLPAQLVLWCAHRWKPPVSVTTAPVRCQWLGRKILSRNLLRGRISKIILKMKTVDLRDWWWNPHVKDNPVLLVLVMLMTSVNFTLLNLVNKMKCPQKSWWIANATLVRDTDKCHHCAGIKAECVLPWVDICT